MKMTKVKKQKVCELCKKKIENETDDRGACLYWLDSEKYPNPNKIFHVHRLCLEKTLEKNNHGAHHNAKS